MRNESSRRGSTSSIASRSSITLVPQLADIFLKAAWKSQWYKVLSESTGYDI